MKTPEQRLESLNRLGMELNSAMPTDVMLKGDGSIWVTVHGNEGIHPRKLTQQQVLELIFKAKTIGDRMISV